MSFPRVSILKQLMGVALVIAVVAAFSVPALAHVKIKKTSPKRGGTACTSIKKATILYNGPIIRGTLKITRLAGKKKVSKGTGGRAAGNVNKLKVGLKKKMLKPGKYRANWDIVAGDGDPQKGKYKFTLSNC